MEMKIFLFYSQKKDFSGETGYVFSGEQFFAVSRDKINSHLKMNSHLGMNIPQ